MSVEQVREASDRFYAALNQEVGGDATAMLDDWSHGSDVSTMHPIGGQQVGWDDVRATWEMAAGAFADGSVSQRDLRIVVLGDVAYTTGTEVATANLGSTPISFSSRCTNIYRREGDAWKMVHHHSDIDPGAVAALQSVMEQSG